MAEHDQIFALDTAIDEGHVAAHHRQGGAVRGRDAVGPHEGHEVEGLRLALGAKCLPLASMLATAF